MKKESVGVQNQPEIKKKKPSGKPFEKGNTVGFKKGQSGNPGGCPKGTPKISIAYMNLLKLPADELAKFVPGTFAELLAWRQARRALGLDGAGVKDAINATEKIADRTEGRPTQRQEIENIDSSEREKVERAIDAWIAAARENIDQLHADGKLSRQQHQAELDSITREMAIRYLAVESPEVKNLIN